MTVAEYKSDMNLQKTLSQMGELSDVFCVYFGENWLRYNDNALYLLWKF